MVQGFLIHRDIIENKWHNAGTNQGLQLAREDDSPIRFSYVERFLAHTVAGENHAAPLEIYQRESEIGGIIDATDAGTARQFVEKYLTGAIK